MPRMTAPVCVVLLGLCGNVFAQPPVLMDEPPPAYETVEPGAAYPEEGYVWPDSGVAYATPCTEWWCRSWYFRVEALALHRSQGVRDGVLVETDAGAPLLGAEDLNFSLEPGISALVGHRIDSMSAWEIAYFGANQWDENLRTASLANLDLPDPIGTDVDDFNNADVITVESLSSFHSAEVNYLHDFAQVSGLIGVRYVNWEELLTISALDNDGDISDYEVGTSNNLYGGQIGLRLARQGPRLNWEFTGKAGIFGNDAQQRQTLMDDDNTIVVRSVGSRESGVSFVGDANLSAHCPLNRVWSVRAGYNVIWLTGLGFAADQVDFTNDLNSGTTLDRDGTVVVHGLNVGLEALW